MRIAIEHVTRYTYEREATYAVQSLRLTPASFDGQSISRWTVAVEPAGEAISTTDGFGNVIHLMTVSAPHRELVVVAKGVAEVEDRSGIVQGLGDAVAKRVYLRRTPLTEPSAAIHAIAARTAGLQPIPRLHEMMTMIRDAVDYRVGATHSETTAAQAIEAGVGVCQDHAHIFVSAARAAGMPARYVTGYLLMDEPSRSDAHHAWAEVWVEGLGWVGFDVANRTCPTDRYVRMASALDANYAAPVRGSRRGGEAEHLDVVVHVQQHAQQQSAQQQNAQQ